MMFNVRYNWTEENLLSGFKEFFLLLIMEVAIYLFLLT